MQYDIEHAIMDALVKQYEDGYFDLSNDDEVIKALSMVIKKLKPRNLWNVLNISAGE